MLEIQPSETKSETVRQRRPREHLTEAEIERLMTVARQGGRYGHRDATAILIAFRHGCEQANWSICNGTRSTSCKRPSAFTG
jgi:hypothetical protein